nr:argininosuccinate lyase [Candidatus Kapabacteria bacterium]
DRIVPAIDEFALILRVLLHVAPQIQPVDGILLNPMYQHLFSVDRVDELVKSGMPFRDAYRQVAQEIKEGAVMHAPQASANDAQAALGSVGNVGIGELRKRLL